MFVFFSQYDYLYDHHYERIYTKSQQIVALVRSPILEVLVMILQFIFVHVCYIFCGVFPPIALYKIDACYINWMRAILLCIVPKFSLFGFSPVFESFISLFELFSFLVFYYPCCINVLYVCCIFCVVWKKIFRIPLSDFFENVCF